MIFPSYNLAETFPGVPLAEITPLSHRAYAVLTRHQTGRATKDGQLNIIGAIDMLDGLEYHHALFMGMVEKLSESGVASNKVLRHLLHEIVAYLNRMGQFWYFTRSDFVRQFIPDPDALMPTLVRFKKFRDKHAAHRAIDYPRKDTLETQWQFAWALSSAAWTSFDDKPGCPHVQSSNWWRDKYFVVGVSDGTPRSLVHFSLEREHPLISGEVYMLLEMLLTAP